MFILNKNVLCEKGCYLDECNVLNVCELCINKVFDIFYYYNIVKILL